jgi:hypothetical protein
LTKQKQPNTEGSKTGGGPGLLAANNITITILPDGVFYLTISYVSDHGPKYFPKIAACILDAS